MVTALLTATCEVVMEKVEDVVAPAATVTEAGTVALGSLLVSITTAPPDGAGPLSVTLLLFADKPPATEIGETVIAERAIAFTVKVAVLVVPL